MKTCAITGAASGIGAALAERYVQAGYQVIAIDQQENAELFVRLGSKLRFIQVDLSQLSASRQITAALAGENLDVLIHSAGINYVAPFVSSDSERQSRVLDINLKAVMLLTRALLAEHSFPARASLVFIASLSHQLSYPGASVYAASKDGISAFARSLSIALKAQEIDVLTVYPGPTRTPQAREHSPDNSREHKRMLPERLALLIYLAQQRRQKQLVPGFSNKCFAFIGSYFPVIAERVMLQSIFRKVKAKTDDF